MSIELFSSIRNCPIFASLTEQESLVVASQFEMINLNEGEVLFYRGDPSDAVYLLITGVLSNFLINKNEQSVLISHVESGQTVGESGVLSNEPRMLTVKASEPCVLGRIPADSFRKLCAKYPGIFENIFKLIINHSQQTMNLIADEYITHWHVIVPVNDQVPRQQVKMLLEAEVKNQANLLFIECDNLEQIKRLVNIPKRSHTYIVVILTSQSLLLPLARRLKIDKIYLLANAQKKADLDKGLIDVLNLLRQESLCSYHLILLYSEHNKPANTALWLEKTRFSSHFHIKLNQAKDFQRLLRFICDKSTALVLGGGGAKGWLHIGLLKALTEKKIEIDAIGGTSIGAIVGACFLISKNIEELIETSVFLTKAYSKIIKAGNLTWPLLSVFSPQVVYTALQDLFREQKIEDLSLPFFCISSDLSSRTQCIHQQGEIISRLFASNSIPGILPPQLINGHLHYDGGLINNLPVDVMRELVGNNSTIIASSLESGLANSKTFDFPPSMNFWQYLLILVNKKKRNAYPELLESITEAMLLGSSVREEQNKLSANILINPNLANFSTYYLKRADNKILFDLGYREGMNITGGPSSQARDKG